MNDKTPHEVSRDGMPPSVSIETARLRLRMFSLDDLDNLAALFSDPDVMKYVGDGKPTNRQEAERALRGIMQRWVRHGFGRWAVEDKETREFLGYGGLRALFGMPEIVYHFAKAHWGKGFATEMGRACLKYGFEELRFERIVAVAKPGNAASIRVMEKLGMRFEKHAHFYGIDVVQYTIAAEEFARLALPPEPTGRD